jgi:hypothetical protein
MKTSKDLAVARRAATRIDHGQRKTTGMLAKK